MQNAFNCSSLAFNNSTNSERCKRNIAATCVIIIAVIVVSIIFYLLYWCFPRRCFQSHLYRLCSRCRCCRRYCAKNFEISIHTATILEKEVRRNLLRGIKTYTESKNPFPVHDLEISQLLHFFRERPGLRRLVGGRLVQYYAHPFAKRIKRNNNKRSRVAPVP